MSAVTGSTILLVDDYPDALNVWELYLRAEGFNVLTAANGHDALARATAEVPDMVVMDLQLPDLSGFEVARELRSRPATHHIPLIAATGYSHAVHLDEARQSGFDSLIVKPDLVALPDVPSRTKIPARELNLALQLIDGMADTWDPRKYSDEYVKALMP